MTLITSTPTSAVTHDGPLLVVSVSDAAAGSALSAPAMREGATALREVAGGQRDAGAILLVGSGRNFCAGGNVRNFASAEHRPTYLREIADTFHAFITALLEAQRPIVAAVNGWAAGAGLSLVLHSDIAIGGTSTKLRPAYLGIGLSPDGGMSWTLPRAVGAARAREIILTNRIIDAEEATRIGILSRVVDDDAVDETAAQVARTLADGPRAAISAARSLLLNSSGTTLRDQLDAEARAISANSGTPEGIEGVDAFIGKRAPDFVAARAREA
ncbi:MAG: enoyl-CoA hydratase-related protein [Gordonia sp. (in: high G+C Gram-positive bacteria)]